MAPKLPDLMARQKCPAHPGQIHEWTFVEFPPDLLVWTCAECGRIEEVHEQIGWETMKLENPQIRFPLTAWAYIAEHMPNDELGAAIRRRIERRLRWEFEEYRRARARGDTSAYTTEIKEVGSEPARRPRRPFRVVDGRTDDRGGPDR